MTRDCAGSLLPSLRFDQPKCTPRAVFTANPPPLLAAVTIPLAASRYERHRFRTAIIVDEGLNSMVRTFPLPAALTDLLAARDQVRAYCRKGLAANGSQVDMKFTLDGNLIGDIGEAVSVELFGIRLVEQSPQGASTGTDQTAERSK